MIGTLQKINDIAFPGAQRLVASEKFVIDISEDAKCKISYLGKNFPAWFINKVETDIPLSVLTYSKLTKSANDTEIVSALGGEEKAELFLAEMFYLMFQQPKGEEGVLLRTGEVNFFYVRDMSGVLRTIRVLWQEGGWGIHAIHPHDPLNLPTWSEGSRIFFRK